MLNDCTLKLLFAGEGKYIELNIIDASDDFKNVFLLATILLNEMIFKFKITCNLNSLEQYVTQHIMKAFEISDYQNV